MRAVPYPALYTLFPLLYHIRYGNDRRRDAAFPEIAERGIDGGAAERVWVRHDHSCCAAHTFASGALIVGFASEPDRDEIPSADLFGGGPYANGAFSIRANHGAKRRAEALHLTLHGLDRLRAARRS